MSKKLFKEIRKELEANPERVAKLAEEIDKLNPEDIKTLSELHDLLSKLSTADEVVLRKAIVFALHKGFKDGAEFVMKRIGEATFS